jgi:hypothetical protein
MHQESIYISIGPRLQKVHRKIGIVYIQIKLPTTKGKAPVRRDIYGSNENGKILDIVSISTSGRKQTIRTTCWILAPELVME